jgi:hypothetical protein
VCGEPLAQIWCERINQTRPRRRSYRNVFSHVFELIAEIAQSLEPIIEIEKNGSPCMLLLRRPGARNVSVRRDCGFLRLTRSL